MLHFHYCQRYTDKVSKEVDIVVRKRISNLRTRDHLRGVSGVFSYNGVYVLQTNTPLPMRTIIQEGRVIIEEKSIIVYFVQDIVDKDDLAPYVEIRKGLWSSYYPISEIDRQSFINSFLEKEEVIEKEPLPDNLISWLTDYRIQVDYDIYESSSWVAFAAGNNNGMRQEDITAFRGLLSDIVNGVGDGDECLNDLGNTRLMSKLSRLNLGILYSKINIGAKIIYFLHGGAHVNRNPELWEELKNTLIKNSKSYQSLDEIGRDAERAYPNWVLKNENEELWKNIQRISESGNFALLTEQTDFLSNFKFPSYIDGQAGSGKSTMLYYLFANAYYYKCLGEIKGDIIFLTENSALLENTKRSIRDILRNNPKYELTDDYIINLDDYFSTLKDFLHSQLENKDEQNFLIEKYLDFSIFKNRYENHTHLPKHIKDNYTPEFVWFVITTYMKGHDLEYEINSENYHEKMPTEAKELIPLSNLIQIERYILPIYTKLLSDEGYWDKSKIIRFIKKEVVTHKRYEVVFCDEAQDFGRIELQFIVNLSEYLQYDRSMLAQHGQGVPVVFAGDPFQTVNPTGFRKEEVKDLFFKELNADLNKNQYKPAYNYRSTQAIVNLSNAIQLLRKQKFEIQGSPQKTKRPQASADEFLDKFISLELLAAEEEHYVEQLKHKTIIIPTDSYEKERYINQEIFLKHFVFHQNIEGINGGNNNDLIRTAVESKGVDYPQVVVYGFGKYFIEKFSSFDSIQDSYETRFFFNKLYVAVTRAQEELIIIDKEITLECFWKPLLQAYAESQWQLESGVEVKDIVGSICKIDKGNSSLISPGTRDVEKEVAHKEKEQALYRNDTDLMRLAASRFIKLGEHKDYFLCKAEEAKMLGNIDAAVIYYRKKEIGLDGIELVANTYWDAERFEDFAAWIGTPKNADQELKLILSSLMSHDRLSPDEVRKLEKNSKLVERIVKKINWSDKLFNKLADFATIVTDKEQQLLLIDVLAMINISNNINLIYEVGRLQYKLKYFSEAVTTWENIPDIENDKFYIKAKVELAKQGGQYANAIQWLGKLWEQSGDELKIDIEKETISIYEKHMEIIDDDHSGITFLYILSSSLMHIQDKYILLKVAKKAEKDVLGKKKTIQQFYLMLLQSGRLTEMAFNFVLVRWVRLANLDGMDIDMINKTYEDLTSKENYFPFTREDMDAVPAEPLYFEPPLPEHISNITIQNFRKFKDVTIENLGLFNIVVGDNNIGKTSLLEAFLFSASVKDYLKRLAFAYIERKNIFPDKKEVNNLLKMSYSLDKSFLADFKNQELVDSSIKFTFRKGRNVWRYSISEDDLELVDESAQKMKIDDLDYSVLKEVSVEDVLQQPFMPYGKGFGMDLAIVYSAEIAPNVKTERQFLRSLELFIPNVERVRADALKGDIFILLEDAEEDIPLHKFGEGANKLFRILLLLTLHKGKRVMIDEIDAGIHYSRFKNFWKIILEISHLNNTQIVATTHNEECVQYFTQALQELGTEYKEKARVVQCKIVAGDLKVRSYDFNNFNLAIERGVELRGGETI